MSLITTIVLVEDHSLFRKGLRLMLEEQPSCRVVAEAHDRRTGMQAVLDNRPDLAFVDLGLGEENGLELIKDIRARFSDLLILVVSMHDESLYAERVLRAGARGYIMKQAGGEKFLLAIRQVLAGQIFVSDKMSARILDAFSGRLPDKSGSPVRQLSDREFEVFRLIGQGIGTRAIAEQLHLSVKTVEVHRANIKGKLGLATATELVRQAVRWVDSQGQG